ncbi:hypothetical protein [Legionella israelensis]|uniref:Uncharacterized protein n=1 Tax=Legionella israelensis TaxID=454 RepID=A0A0W0WI02_9GAMM|nr:hypothetical protein [Legionella israelensis]KTD31951.1 hypothetical protein Lisr_0570 [Legionella israelensis]QBS10730.1 hypothetical protein E4T55_13325 [Legionella israelensis]SCY28547.1 hypothetical protein SAMN02746069_01903 [Legionella israelensis DSM 19235]STX57696.1 Uncharacterised protein [Legionella israelensis]
MINIRAFIIIKLVFCLLLNQAFAVSNKQIATRNFWHPMYHGGRLAYCMLNQTCCGKPVADRYCKSMGYDYASQQIIAHNIGLTHYISTKARCKGWRCNGFVTIACVKKIPHTPDQTYHYSKKKFVYPRYNNYRVDWCYGEHTGCGLKAAKSFCRRLGYMEARQFKREKAIHASKTIGSQKLCFGPSCDGFKYIVCSR